MTCYSFDVSLIAFGSLCGWGVMPHPIHNVAVPHGIRHAPLSRQCRFNTCNKFDLAPVPLSIFRSNSKFDENSERSSFAYTRPITTILCTRHDSDTVETCAKYRCDRPRTFYTRVLWIFSEFRIFRNFRLYFLLWLSIDLIVIKYICKQFHITFWPARTQIALRRPVMGGIIIKITLP